MENHKRSWIACLRILMAVLLMLILFVIQPSSSIVLAGGWTCGHFLTDGSRILFQRNDPSDFPFNGTLFLWQGKLVTDYETNRSVNIPASDEFYFLNIGSLEEIISIDPIDTKFGTVTQAMTGIHAIEKEGGIHVIGDCAAAPISTPTATVIATSTSTPTRTYTSTPTITPTSQPTRTSTYTSTPSPSPTTTPQPSPTSTPTPTKSPGFFTIQTPKDVVSLALVIGGTSLTAGLALLVATRIDLPFGKKFMIAELPHRIPENKELRTVVNLPAKREWPRGRAYFFIRMGKQELSATTIWSSKPKQRRYINLHNLELPMQVTALIQANDRNGTAEGEYTDEGSVLDLRLPFLVSGIYAVRLVLRFAPLPVSVNELRSENQPRLLLPDEYPEEVYFDSNVTVTQFLGLTATQISFLNLIGMILGILLALLGFFIKTQ
jgi:hypothetical protein